MIMSLRSHTITGKLPKEVNINAVDMKLDLLVDENEEPPPIPPRLIYPI